MRLDGQRVGQYRILRLLRAGGMGEVYVADDEYLQRRVAIKVIWTDVSHYPDPAEASEAARLFVREAQAVAQLDHMYILPVYDSGEGDIDGVSFMYMVMPFRARGSFADWLHRYGGSRSLSLWEVERIVRQAAGALQHAHNHQIIHQDVKPSNFLLHGDAERADLLHLQLADFGVARFMTTTGQSQIIRGTPAYMAPELWDGQPVAATDQYALAVMAYELLTGQSPFTGQNQQQLWYQHFHFAPPPPSTMKPHIPAELDTVLLRALAKYPQDRFPSIFEFAQAFRRVLTEEPAGLSRSGVVEEGRPQLNEALSATYQERRPKGWTVMLVGIALLLIVAGSLTLSYSVWNSHITGSMNATATASNATASSNSTAIVGKTATSIGQTRVAATTQANATATQMANASAQASASAIAGVNATATAEANATATQIASVNATATRQAEIAPYQTAVAGTPTIDDSMQDNNGSYGWNTQYDPGYGGCSFAQGAYHALVQQGSFTPCLAQSTNFTNFTCEARMTIVAGNQGGIAFRADGTTGAFYYFHINTSGAFALDIYNNNLFVKTIATGTSSAINTGSHQSNLLTVFARNNTLTLFINMLQVATVTDATFTSGEIGVVAEDTGSPADIAFSDVKVWVR